MRRSELDPKLSALAQRLFADARDVLLVGVSASLGEREVVVVDEPGQALVQARRFAALLYRLPADTTVTRLRAGLVALRPALADGAVVLLAAEKRAPALDQLRAVLAREPVPRARLDSLCEAVLLSGLGTPRVYEGVASSWLLLSAAVPVQPSELDAFFAQPARDPSR
jgi:hypothetical protein